MAVNHAPRILFTIVAVLALAAFAGCGNDSTPASPNIDTAPPAVPSGVSAWGQIGSDAEITLSWDANVTDADLAGYVLYRSIRPDGPFHQVSSDLINSNSYTDRRVDMGNHYYYRVAARDASGNESGFSQLIDIALDPNSGPLRLETLPSE